MGFVGVPGAKEGRFHSFLAGGDRWEVLVILEAVLDRWKLVGALFWWEMMDYWYRVELREGGPVEAAGFELDGWRGLRGWRRG